MDKEMKRGRSILHWHLTVIFLVLYDIVAVNAAYFLALWFRYDCAFSAISKEYLRMFLTYVPINTAVTVAVMAVFRLYNSIWRFASISELTRTVVASLVSWVVHIVGISILCGRMPITYFLIGGMLQFLLVLGIRFSYRFVLLERSKLQMGTKKGRVMLVGAGAAGQNLLKNIQEQSKEKLQIVCIIDDNPNKWHRHISGVPVVGGRDSIPAAAVKYNVDKIFVALPSATETDRSRILNICKETGCQIRNLPGMDDLVSGQVTLQDMREVAVEELLGRDPIQVDVDQMLDHLRGKVVMVTGGGGSIGSELCRQIAAHGPRQLIIFEVYENNAYEIEQELRRKYPDLDLQVRIGSVRDSRCLETVFSEYCPDIVYHAAAHKHVPLMENSPCEAIKNNVIGTYKTAYAALLHGCKRFVLISTDKAVNPTNIMGASKRLCEMVIQSFDRAVKEGTTAELPRLFTHYVKGLEDMEQQAPQDPCTEFVAVRFGNVLGSNGSVIPLFRKQIAAGGPVTVTHPDIIRYFMTIPEAVSLVIQAGAYAKGGEIFVLDMGAPVKIDDLARNLIKLSGLRPDTDIKIVYTGLRPGEKLYEEKLMAEEGMGKTPNDLIHIGNPVVFDTEEFLTQLRRLMVAAYDNEPSIRDMVAAMVPTYHPAPQGNEKKDETYRTLCAQANK